MCMLSKKRVGVTRVRTGSDSEAISGFLTLSLPWVAGIAQISGVHGEYEDLFLRMHGRHQVDNLATAIAACEMFLGRSLDPDVLSYAVASITSPGRLEVVRRRPVVLIDGAHNAQGFRGLASAISPMSSHQ